MIYYGASILIIRNLRRSVYFRDFENYVYSSHFSAIIEKTKKRFPPYAVYSACPGRVNVATRSILRNGVMQITLIRGESLNIFASGCFNRAIRSPGTPMINDRTTVIVPWRRHFLTDRATHTRPSRYWPVGRVLWLTEGSRTFVN